MRQVSFARTLGIGLIAASLSLFVSTAARAAALPGLISNGGSMNSFSEAVNLPLRYSDLDRFVDPQIKGRDRLLAIWFLSIMPPNMRGDFVSEQPDGRILSNKVALAMTVRIRPLNPTKVLRPLGKTRPAPFTNRVNPLTYPHTGGSGGSWIRSESAQGVTAAFGYASFPCDSSYNSFDDTGNMYFNAYTAASSGSLVDAGLAANYDKNLSSTDAEAFIVSNGYVYSGWLGGSGVPTNPKTVTWHCGTPVAMMYGDLPLPSGWSFFVAGLPDYDPTQLALPPPK